MQAEEIKKRTLPYYCCNCMSRKVSIFGFYDKLLLLLMSIKDTMRRWLIESSCIYIYILQDKTKKRGEKHGQHLKLTIYDYNLCLLILQHLSF